MKEDTLAHRSWIKTCIANEPKCEAAYLAETSERFLDPAENWEDASDDAAEIRLIDVRKKLERQFPNLQFN